MAFSSYGPGESYHVPPYLEEPYGGYPHYGAHPGSAYSHPNGYNKGPLTVVANSSVLSGDSMMYPWYRVAFLGGIDLRKGPHIDAPRVGITLGQNATFAASEELPQPDGRVYLRLADGRGWAFDDSQLYPHDPVVTRGFWSPIGPGSSKTDPIAALQPGGGPGLGLEPPGGFPPPAHPMGDAAARAAPMAPPVGPPPPAPGLPQHVPCGGFGQLGLGALGTGEEHRAIPTRIADWPDRFDRAPGPPGPGPVGPVGPAGHLFS